jgi:hypothetical protein
MEYTPVQLGAYEDYVNQCKRVGVEPNLIDSYLMKIGLL